MTILPISSYGVIKVENFSGAPVPSDFFLGFDVSTDVKYGSLSSPDSDIFKGSSLMGVGAGAEVVIGWPFLFIGAGADYSKLYQLETTSDLDDSNTSGTLMTSYALAGLYLFRWRISLKYFLDSTYSFDQKTLGGEDFILTTPEGSFGLDITISGREGRALSLEFNSISYGGYTLGDSKKEFKSGTVPKILTYGVVYAIRY